MNGLQNRLQILVPKTGSMFVAEKPMAETPMTEARWGNEDPLRNNAGPSCLSEPKRFVLMFDRHAIDLGSSGMPE